MIEEYRLKNGDKRYKFQTYLGIDPETGKEKRTTRQGFKTRKEAQLEEARLKIDIEENGFTGKRKRVKFKELYELWLPHYEQSVKGSTFKTQTMVITNHILPVFGDKFVDKISVASCQKAVNDWVDKFKTFRNMVSLTGMIFNYGVSLGLLDSNPMDRTIKPTMKKQPKLDFENFYSRDELITLFNAIEDEDIQIKLMYRILAFTGLRKGEVFGLFWSDLDFEENTLTVNRTVARGKNGKTLQSPKTVKSNRKISLDDNTVKLFKLWKFEQRKRLLSLGLAKVIDTAVFTNVKGEVYDPNQFNRIHKNIIEAHGLKDITVHGFRHTHCSLLFESGASIKEVQERLGHTNIKTTLDIYTHVTEQTKEKTAEKFAKYVNF